MKNKTYFLDLFSGIGGFALAAYWAALRFDGHYFSEIEPYAVEIYQKRFPGAIALGDITKIDYERLPKGDWLICGGFPCQPHSSAGKRKGKNDKRDLWPECARVLRELQPRIALFENVPRLLNSNEGKFFNRVLSDISQSGYDAEWCCISAAEIGASHKRERVWITAYPSSIRFKTNDIQKRKSDKKLQEMRTKKNDDNLARIVREQNGKIPIRYFLREDDGIPGELDRVGGLGNAIVPQCAELIFNLPAFDRWRLQP